MDVTDIFSAGDTAIAWAERIWIATLLGCATLAGCCWHFTVDPMTAAYVTGGLWFLGAILAAACDLLGEETRHRATEGFANALARDHDLHVTADDAATLFDHPPLTDSALLGRRQALTGTSDDPIDVLFIWSHGALYVSAGDRVVAGAGRHRATSEVRAA